MSLDKKSKGNPNWVPGKSGNPNGRPPGAKSLKGILKVAATLYDKKRHPVNELVRIADQAERDGKKELAADIWQDLLRYCEPQKKAQEVLPEKPTNPEESKAAAEAAMALLQELENGQPGKNVSSVSGDSSGLADGAAEVPAEAGTKDNLRHDKGE